MSKADTNAKTLEQAQADLAAAQEAYEALKRQGRTRMSGEQARQHAEKCRKALAAKRHARIALQAVRTGKPVPPAAAMIETKAADDGGE